MAEVTTSWDGTCGPTTMKKCASGCCSIYGNCGTSPEHCSGGCQHAFGTGCTDPDVSASWQNAAANGDYDQEAGGHYYFDPQEKLFWTWDSPENIARKFKDIVATYGLGGVMAWSLGEDTYDWRHVRAIAAGVKALGEGSSEYVTSEYGAQESEQVEEPETEGWILVDPPAEEYTTEAQQPTSEVPDKYPAEEIYTTPDVSDSYQTGPDPGAIEAIDCYQETQHQPPSNTDYDSAPTEDTRQYWDEEAQYAGAGPPNDASDEFDYEAKALEGLDYDTFSGSQGNDGFSWWARFKAWVPGS